MRKCLFSAFLVLAVISGRAFGQEENSGAGDSTEVFIIQSFIPVDAKDKFILSFMTSEPATSRLVLEGIGEFSVSDTLTDSHAITVTLKDKALDAKVLTGYVIVTNEKGESTRSETFEIDVPDEYEIKEGTGYFVSCAAGGLFFITPYTGIVQKDGGNYFTLGKELPFLSLYDSEFGNAIGYFSIDVQYISSFNKELNARLFDTEWNFRLGYKHLISVPVIEYISPGVSGYTDFNGFNGVSFEVSAGIFRFFNSFTLYIRDRFTLSPGDGTKNFNEITIGLYTNFLTLHL